MTREEFIKIAAYVAAGCGKALSAPSLEVYFDLLGDLPADVFALAAKRVLLTHRYATFPTVAELREAATLTARGEVAALPSGEAWEIGWSIVRRTDPEIEGSFDRASANAPALVKRTILAIGLPSLCYGDDPVSVVRAQFIRVYEQLAARESARRLMPAPVARAIEARAAPALAIAGLGPQPFTLDEPTEPATPKGTRP